MRTGQRMGTNESRESKRAHKGQFRERRRKVVWEGNNEGTWNTDPEKGSRIQSHIEEEPAAKKENDPPSEDQKRRVIERLRESSTSWKKTEPFPKFYLLMCLEIRNCNNIYMVRLSYYNPLYWDHLHLLVPNVFWTGLLCLFGFKVWSIMFGFYLKFEQNPFMNSGYISCALNVFRTDLTMLVWLSQGSIKNCSKMLSWTVEILAVHACMHMCKMKMISQKIADILTQSYYLYPKPLPHSRL